MRRNKKEDPCQQINGNMLRHMLDPAAGAARWRLCRPLAGSVAAPAAAAATAAASQGLSPWA